MSPLMLPSGVPQWLPRAQDLQREDAGCQVHLVRVRRGCGAASRPGGSHDPHWRSGALMCTTSDFCLFADAMQLQPAAAGSHSDL